MENKVLPYSLEGTKIQHNNLKLLRIIANDSELQGLLTAGINDLDPSH